MWGQPPRLSSRAELDRLLTLVSVSRALAGCNCVLMQITEIFKSIQGESTHAGLPCVFVRLTGCNLRCTWCDSEYTFQGGRKMSVEQVLDEVTELSPSGGLVEITGGEPMLQEREVVPMMQKLIERGYMVLLETQRRTASRPCAARSHQDSRRKVSRLRRGRYLRP